MEEHQVLKAVQCCESAKSTERKKGVKDLTELLANPATVRVLNNNSSVDSVNWNIVFVSVHRCLIQESESWQAAESKGSATSSANTTRCNLKAQFASLVGEIVTKGSSSQAHIKCSDILICCSKIFQDRYLLKNFGEKYMNILKDIILPNRKYRSQMDCDQWKELFQYILDFFGNKKDCLKDWTVHCAIELMELVVHYGCQESHLIIQVKNKLLPLIEVEYFKQKDHPDNQNAFLSLTLRACTNVAKESRTGVCHLGECILDSVIKMYNSKFDESSPLNKLVIRFLLFQLHCHHPNGVKQGNQSAYAYDWDIWNRHLWAMYRIVFNAISKGNRILKVDQPFSELFLDLYVELCHQLFGSNQTVYDMSLSINETVTASAPKRRKLSVGVDSILEELRSSKKDASCGHWISLILRILQKHPILLLNEELHQLLEILSEMQCNCRNLKTMRSICECYEQVLEIMSLRNLTSEVWVKVWETSLRSIGLNQTESHPLLRKLISKNVVPIASLESVLRMYLSQMIQLTNESLRTMIIVLSVFPLPESSSDAASYRSESWELPVGSARVILLEWLLTCSWNVDVDPELLAEAVVSLVAQRKLKSNKMMSEMTKCSKLNELPLEDSYCLCAFESGLLLPFGTQLGNDGSSHGSFFISKNPLDSVSYAKLELFLTTKCQELEQQQSELENEMAPTQMPETLLYQQKLKLTLCVAKYACLLANVLSDMVKYDVIELQSLEEGFLYKIFLRIIDLLQNLLSDALKPEASCTCLVQDVPKVCEILESLRTLYGGNLMPSISTIIRNITPVGVMIPIMTLFQTFPDDHHQEDKFPDPSNNSLFHMMSCGPWSDVDKIHLLCLDILTSYGCPNSGTELIPKQITVIFRILKVFKESDTYDLSLLTSFVLVFRSLSKILAFPCLDTEKHVRMIVLLLGSLCQKWKGDAEVSSYILLLLKDVFRHVLNHHSKYERVCSLKLFWVLYNKNFGPIFSLQLISCFNMIMKVDKASKWARWVNSSSLRQKVDVETIPTEALRKFEDDEDHVAVVEEVLFLLLSPFHEVRLAAVACVADLLSGDFHSSHWKETMFQRLSVILWDLFLIKDNDLNREEKIDEGSNRTAVILHVLGAVVASSVKCYKQALNLMLRFLKEKDISIGAVRKVFDLLPKPMRIKSTTSFVAYLLGDILDQWFKWGYQLQEFPYQIMNFSSFSEFIKYFKDIIVPVVLRSKNSNCVLKTICQEMKCTLQYIFEICFPSLYAYYLPFLADSKYKEENQLAVRKQFESITSTLGEEKVKELVSSKIKEVLIEVTKCVWDATHHESILGIDSSSVKPNSYFISHVVYHSTFKYLQMVLGTEKELLVDICSQKPLVIYRVLLDLRENMCSPATVDQRTLSLHQYCAFVHVVAIHLKKSQLPFMADFVLSDITHSLLHIINEYQKDPFMYDVCVGSCSYLKVMFEHLLPICAPIVSHLLPTIVGSLMPLAHGDGTLAERSLLFLKLLVITNQSHLQDAIGKLPPFPDAPVFEELHRVHHKLKYDDKLFTLEEEIRHFLSSVYHLSNSADQHSLFDGLSFLKKQLSEKKSELSNLYHNLETIRGFTKDCKQSVLHQLVCSLINLAASQNKKIQVEVARCLGELGPADLTTLVLKPAEGCFNKIKGYSDPIKCVMALAAHLLVDYLMEADVCVVKAASSALQKLMHCRGADSLHSNKDDCDGIIASRKLSPFILKTAARYVPSLPKDSTKVMRILFQDDIWCPAHTSHAQWIKSLACAFLTSLSDEESYFRDLVMVCEVKTSFAEEILPVVCYLGLTYSSDVCNQLCMRLAQFFENHFNSLNPNKNSQTLNFSSSGASVYLNRASVQCMLNVVNFVRLQKTFLSDQRVTIDLNYLHVASAAQFCSAYYSSIMYLELWCNHENRHPDFDGGMGVPYVDFICEVNPEEGKILQSLLRKSYKEIGDHDALYGCGSSILRNPSTRVNQYEFIGRWDKALLNYDAKLCHSHDAEAANGLTNALKRSGLLHLMSTFLEAVPFDLKGNLYLAQIECMWRLGKWGTPFSPPSKDISFEWNQYSALQAIRNGNKVGVNEYVALGRQQVLSSLRHASLESCNNIYKPLSQLQALQEIEDTVTIHNTQELLNKWHEKTTLPYNDIYLWESVLAQRAKIIESLIYQQNVIGQSSENLNYLLQPLTQLHMDTAEVARKEDQIEISEQWLHSLSVMSHLTVEDKLQLRFEEAQVAWCSGKGAIHVATNSVACQLLGMLLKDIRTSENESRKKFQLHAKALILYGKWMAETCSENPQKIIEDYLEEALNILDKEPSPDSIKDQLEAHYCLAHYADLEYQRITEYIKSESFQSKVQRMLELQKEGNALKQLKTQEYQRTASINLKSSSIDQEEINHSYRDQDQFIVLAMRHYLTCMKLGTGENLPVFRLISLWLANASHDKVNELVSSSVDSIQTFKFVTLLPQLAAHIGDNLKDHFTKTIYNLMLCCCVEHPHHSLPLVLALANSYEDPNSKAKSNPEPRVLGATRMLSELRKNSAVKPILVEMEKIAIALISLAYAPIPNEQTDNIAIPSSEKIRNIRNLNNAMLPIINLPVQSDSKYDNIIGIFQFESKYSIAGGINKPKKIRCVGTDGVKRLLLVKGEDDLRQDAVMQQVFRIMNTLLQGCKETKLRRLLIRTYKIVPLSQRCGVLEWCENTAPLQIILPVLHNTYYPKDLKGGQCRKLVDGARQKSNSERLRVYKEICKKFSPAFRFFFTENFPTPAEWFEHRLAYIHSVATNSMVGYILGLGDRHVANILVDKSTAELIHIDFGIAFEQGRLLPTPETVPFRLTRDIVDGMGISGTEGVFRRSCEKTVSVLRKNQEKIITILEVLLYDPLYQWALTPKKCANLQKDTSNVSSNGDGKTLKKSANLQKNSDGDGKESSQNKNKMAERALSRLQKKLQGTEEGPASSIEGQVNRLIQQARDPSNLSRLFVGWQAYY